MNLLLTNGDTITATAWGNTLWYLADPAAAPSWRPSRTTTTHWQEVPDRTLLAASRTDVLLTPLKDPHAQEGARGPFGIRTHQGAQHVSPFLLTRTLPEDATDAALRADVLHGLTHTPKTLPPKWFYDAHGSELLTGSPNCPSCSHPAGGARDPHRPGPRDRRDDRCAHPRRAGVRFVRENPPSARRAAGAAHVRAGRRQRECPHPGRAGADRRASGARRARVDRRLHGRPRAAGNTGAAAGGVPRRHHRQSAAEERATFLASVRALLYPGDTLLLGTDLVKDESVLVAAYDDAAGVTAEFNKNVLHVVNRELGADFDPDAFAHVALWDDGASGSRCGCGR